MIGEFSWCLKFIEDSPHLFRHEKDLVLFHNRGVTHTVVGAFKKDQVRKFHQCNLAASDFPTGPNEDDVKKWA